MSVFFTFTKTNCKNVFIRNISVHISMSKFKILIFNVGTENCKLYLRTMAIFGSIFYFELYRIWLEIRKLHWCINVKKKKIIALPRLTVSFTDRCQKLVNQVWRIYSPVQRNRTFFKSFSTHKEHLFLYKVVTTVILNFISYSARHPFWAEWFSKCWFSLNVNGIKTNYSKDILS